MLNPSNITSTTQNYSYSYKEESAYNNYNDFAKSLKNVRSDSNHDYADFDNSIGGFSPLKLDPMATLEESASKTLQILLDMLYKAKGLTRNPLKDYNYDSSSPLWPGTKPSYSNIASVLGTASGAGTIWNQVTDSYYSLEESETTTFSSTGTAITADGRSIEFDVSFTMSSSFKATYQTSAFTQYEQVLTDPLVIHLDSNPAALSAQHFYFDIDCDGKKDELSSLDSGSGFLALDKNEDGTINDGSELFGTSSGNGFNDLAQYDDDGNGWIDEGDSVYRLLKVWIKDEQGNDQLLSLKDADVGAIYLGSSKTPFSLTGEDQKLDGVVRSSGIYLKESGGSGHISQIDLAKH